MLPVCQDVCWIPQTTEAPLYTRLMTQGMRGKVSCDPFLPCVAEPDWSVLQWIIMMQMFLELSNQQYYDPTTGHCSSFRADYGKQEPLQRPDVAQALTFSTVVICMGLSVPLVSELYPSLFQYFHVKPRVWRVWRTWGTLADPLELLNDFDF